MIATAYSFNIKDKHEKIIAKMAQSLSSKIEKINILDLKFFQVSGIESDVILIYGRKAFSQLKTYPNFGDIPADKILKFPHPSLLENKSSNRRAIQEAKAVLDGFRSILEGEVSAIDKIKKITIKDGDIRVTIGGRKKDDVNIQEFKYLLELLQKINAEEIQLELADNDNNSISDRDSPNSSDNISPKPTGES